jgi:FPC/CPF motif-containing protein YcgG
VPTPTLCGDSVSLVVTYDPPNSPQAHLTHHTAGARRREQTQPDPTPDVPTVPTPTLCGDSVSLVVTYDPPNSPQAHLTHHTA